MCFVNIVYIISRTTSALSQKQQMQQAAKCDDANNSGLGCVETVCTYLFPRDMIQYVCCLLHWNTTG